jgi:calcium-dependent protein kinase
VKTLTTLDHPNIVKYYETYDDSKYIYLVMEYCKGGELFDKITNSKNGVFMENDAKKIMKKLLLAINHCHGINIAHRDIKPENIMYGADGEVKLIDFGLAKSQKKKQTMHTIAGTPYYMAPEVLKGKYGVECDIWSLGVLLYILLSGYLPFSGNSRAEIFEAIADGKFTMN